MTEELLNSWVSAVNHILWDYLLIYGLIGIGLFFTLYLGVPQITRFGEGMKQVFGGLFKKREGGKDEKSLSSFQALAVAISAQIGTGNVAGVATAITAGGPGAIFWMWLSAILGMSTIFSEAVLAQKYRVVSHGKYIGGPAFYITHGLTPKLGYRPARLLAGVFSVALILALGFIGNATQSNSITSAVTVAFDLPPLAVGLAIAALAAAIIVGGIERIAKFAQFVVPFMALVYMICALVILVQFSAHIVPVMRQIVVAAFDPAALGGGLAGISVREAIRFGVARGLFSNEAGMGSTPHAHATAQVGAPGAARHGGFYRRVYRHAAGVHRHRADYFAHRCQSARPQRRGGHARGVSHCFRPLGQKLLGRVPDFFCLHHHYRLVLFRRIEYPLSLQTPRLGRLPHAGVVCHCAGALGKVDVVWNMSDMFNGFMVMPNLLALFLLRKEVRAAYQDYLGRKKSGQPMSYPYEQHL